MNTDHEAIMAKAASAVLAALEEQLSRQTPVDPVTGRFTDRERARIEAQINYALDRAAISLGGAPGCVVAQASSPDLRIDPEIVLRFIDLRTGQELKSDAEFWAALANPVRNPVRNA